MPKQAPKTDHTSADAPAAEAHPAHVPPRSADEQTNASTATLEAPAASEPAADAAPEVPTIDPDRVRSLAPKIEALLITSGRPLTPTRLAQALGLAPLPDETHAARQAVGAADPAAEPVVVTRRRRRKGPEGPTPEALIAACVASLNETYDQTSRSFRIEAVAGGYRLMTLASFRPVIEALHGVSAQSRLSRAAIESLAIIAYRQPMTRHQLEAIRGVSCGEVLSSLLERRLVEIAGRAEELGRPLLYATSRQFLGAFGLSSLKDLPSPAELGIARAHAEATPSVAPVRSAAVERAAEPAASSDADSGPNASSVSAD